ncbi:hypothetical protein [Flavobacterium sp. CAN_S2]|uniref:hypothetical protein n=1 Tax=Flavobacterium sp. CAN_S2 TaxID=2787726 RepID=UPI0018C97675
MMTREEIVRKCKEYRIYNYNINLDGSVDVMGNVNLHPCLQLTELALNFNKVSGRFDCSNNKLTTLKGSPKSVGNDFNCSYNKLTSLEFGPEYVGDFFNCHSNLLTSLEFLPLKVGRIIDIRFNNLSVNSLLDLIDKPYIDTVEKSMNEHHKYWDEDFLKFSFGIDVDYIAKKREYLINKLLS